MAADLRLVVTDDEALHPYQHAEHTMTWADRIDWILRDHANPALTFIGES